MREPCPLDSILEPGGLSVLFQPIFEVQEPGLRLHALECLSRGPKGTQLEPADALFQYVRSINAEARVDRECVAHALREAGQLRGVPTFSFNVHASTLDKDPDFPAFVGETAERHQIANSRLIVEIVEYSPSSSGRALIDALDTFRCMGMRIAVDDIGAGFSYFRKILDCRPDYFKLDRYFVNQAHEDDYRQALLEAVSGLARKCGARVVAEGVENFDELNIVKVSGIDLVQGYLFCPPLPATLLQSGFVRTNAGCLS